jgi:hypothetical protein
VPSTENYITQSAGDARYQALGALGSSTPSTVDAGDVGTAGVSSSASRADHEHPVSVTTAQLVPAAWLAAWTTFTPTLTQSGAVTKTVTYAKYIQMGKTVMAQGYLVVTGTGTASNIVLIGLPVAANIGSGGQLMGTGFIVDTSAGAQYKALAVIQGANTTIGLVPTNATGNFDTLGNNVFTAALASGDVVAFNVTYEAA